MNRYTICIMLAAVLCLRVSLASAEIPAADFAAAMDQYLTSDANMEKVGGALTRFFQKKQKEMAEKEAKDEAGKLEEQFKNPVKVDVGSSPVRGNPNAKITIVEFSDFQCPYCKRGYEVMEQLLKDYPNEVKLVFKNMPLPFHPDAKPAAVAALAAMRQGKFWEMYDKLFTNQANQNGLKEEAFIKYAGEIGLNVDKFKADLKDAELPKAIEADAKQGESLGVQGTPGFFVNGIQVRGARPAEFFKMIIDRWKSQH